MGFSCKDYNVVRFDLTGSGQVRVFNPGVCNNLRSAFKWRQIDNERGFKWILTMVDVFSKYIWARPFKNKSAEEVKETFSHIFKERRPIVLQTDNGKEFKNTVLADYLHRWGITQVFSKAYTPTTQGMVEQYNQTLKHKIFNGFLQNKNKKWVDDLASYVENINTAKQSVTNEAPLDTQKSITTELQAKIEQRLIERNERKTEKAPRDLSCTKGY